MYDIMMHAPESPAAKKLPKVGRLTAKRTAAAALINYYYKQHCELR